MAWRQAIIWANDSQITDAYMRRSASFGIQGHPNRI